MTGNVTVLSSKHMWQQKHVTLLSEEKFIIWLYNFLTSKISKPIYKEHISLRRRRKYFYKLYESRGR